MEEINNLFRYCGEYLDSEKGNYYLRARYYDPEAERFITEDSYKGEAINPLSLNYYTYCSNNPVNFCDPTGNWEQGVAIRNDQVNQGNTVIYNKEYHSITIIERSGSITKLYQSYNGKGDFYIDKNGVARYGYSSDSFAKSHKRHSTTFQGAESNVVSGSNVVLSNSLPKTGKPNSKEKIYNPDGSVKQEREYGPDGQPVKDTDYNHGGAGHQFPHEHVWKDGKRQSGVPVPQTGQTTKIKSGAVKTTSWATIGTAAYWIISEASRLVFPARNFVPVP